MNKCQFLWDRSDELFSELNEAKVFLFVNIANELNHLLRYSNKPESYFQVDDARSILWNIHNDDLFFSFDSFRYIHFKCSPLLLTEQANDLSKSTNDLFWSARSCSIHSRKKRGRHRERKREIIQAMSRMVKRISLFQLLF